MALEHLVHAARSDRVKSGRSRSSRTAEGTWRTTDPGTPRPVGPDGPRVLVVDPNATIRRAMVELLRLHELTVAEAADADGALTCLREWRPTVAVVDPRLRNGDTWLHVLRLLQAMDPRLEVIISAAANDPLPAAEARSAGAFAVYSRSRDFQELVDAIHNAHQARARQDP
jgi:DNA-binding NtrC family response regulator